MRYLPILIILLIPHLCFGTTNSVLTVESAPAYNACNGALIEQIPAGSEVSVNVTIAEGTLTSAAMVGTPISVTITVSQGSALNRNTDSTLLIDPAPAYNACDGALIATISGTPISIAVTVAQGAFEITMAGTSVSIIVTIAKPRQKINFSQGITFDQGIIWEGDDYIKWQSNPNAVMLAP